MRNIPHEDILAESEPSKKRRCIELCTGSRRQQVAFGVRFCSVRLSVSLRDVREIEPLLKSHPET